MSAVTEDVDLSWVTFSGEDDGCEIDGCLSEAVALAVFSADCDCAEPEALMCVMHRDLTLAASRICCGKCDAVWTLLRMEPVR